MGWTEASIGELIGSGKLWVKNGYADGRFNSEGIGIPHLRTFNISDAGEIDLSQIKSVSPPPPDDPHRLRHGDVIFNNTNSEELVGKAALFDLAGEFVLSNHMTILRVLDREHIEPAFLARSLHRKWITGEARMLCRRHVNQASINLDRLKGVRLLFPPLPEQRAIAGVLRMVQRAREACERVLAATRQLKQSLLHHLFTYGPVPFPHAPHVPLKETEIGEVPECWKSEPLGRVADVGYGIQAAVAHLEDSSRGIPILTNINITSGGDIDLTTLRYYEVPQAKRDRFILRKGDVLFNWRSGSQDHVGKTALFMLDGEYTHSSFILRMRCSSAIRPQFLANYLHWLRSCRFFARTRQQSSVNSVFNKSLSKTIPVLLPPLEVQDEIARQLGAVDAKIAALEKRRAALDALFRSLLEHLMTGRLRLPEFGK